MRSRFFILTSLLLFVLFFVTGCNLPWQQDGSPVPIEKAKQQLSQLGFTPIGMHFIMDYPYKERPWICYCKNSKNEEWGVVLYPNGDVRKVQLGIKENISKEQMIKKLVTLGYKHDQYMDDDLSLTVNKGGKFFWIFHPIKNEGGKERINHNWLFSAPSYSSTD